MERIIKLAIADDHVMIRKGVIEIIRDFGGFTVEIEASNGKELFDQLSEAEVLPDIVVMDISMPVWDGYETLDAIRKEWPELKVLVLTMHKHEFAVIKMFRSGANGYILKNSSPKELQRALITIFDTGLYFSEIASINLLNRVQNSDVIPFLSEKEIQLIKYCHQNKTYQEIGDIMGVSERTVAGYRDSVFNKLGVNSRIALVICGIQMGLIPVE